ncbi:MAG TPA: hypothetical protein VJI98_03830 [Candidatus Nanoarchaeia archaeon]|nr:hypothetical protein [Candidatus Nanoarchaeia archaeon]
MTEIKLDVWVRNQNDIAKIAAYVPEVREVDPDRFLHLGSITNTTIANEGSDYFKKSTEKGFLYWVEDKQPKKCSFNRNTQEYSIENFSYPQPLNRFMDYLGGFSCGSLLGGTALAVGHLIEKYDDLIKLDFATLPPWVIIGILTATPAYAFVTVLDLSRKKSHDHETQELMIDRQAWQNYRRSVFGRRW